MPQVVHVFKIESTTSKCLGLPGQNLNTDRLWGAGLDFLNHRKGSRVRWSPSVEKDTDTGCINLQCPAHDTPKNGDEVCIEYSQDASNFTLFFQYGFVEEMNEYDYVRIRYPCDASELQSELMNSRLALLQVCTIAVHCFATCPGTHCCGVIETLV